MALAENDAPGRALELLTDAQIDFNLKNTIFKIQECPDPVRRISHQSMDLEADLKGAMTEIFLAKPRHVTYA